MIYCYKWLSPDCVFTPVTDSWEVVEVKRLLGKPCTILRKKKPCKKQTHYI